jgi:addiction module RelE/StbE family toxin
MRLRFTPRATRDLEEIADYFRDRSPSAAQRVRAAIMESLQNLILAPRIGRRQSVEGVRKLVTRKYSYLVSYTIEEPAGEVVILTIRHHAQEREFSDL